ncbi:MAG: rRNA maturation RNAse YbeY [Candidatus Phytoplasma australasiaticum]|nr:rRNA maturation RNAse YbeY [Candidatus Phytoplasma australasiaticum]
MALPKAFKQAIQHNIRDEQEISFLALHGYFHLKGYEDKTEANECSLLF